VTKTTTSADARKTTSPRASASRAGAKTSPAQVPVRENETPWTAAELKEIRKVLLEEIELHEAEISQAEGELEDLLRGSGDGAGDDQADAGAKTFEREHEITLANNARDMLRQAEHALERLDAGTYGTCENCGNPVGKGRLQAFPRATLCVTCKTKQERH
jgi:RNA polymerase-binding protein DksA